MPTSYLDAMTNLQRRSAAALKAAQTTQVASLEMTRDLMKTLNGMRTVFALPPMVGNVTELATDFTFAVLQQQLAYTKTLTDILMPLAKRNGGPGAAIDAAASSPAMPSAADSVAADSVLAEALAVETVVDETLASAGSAAETVAHDAFAAQSRAVHTVVDEALAVEAVAHDAFATQTSAVEAVAHDALVVETSPSSTAPVVETTPGEALAVAERITTALAVEAPIAFESVAAPIAIEGVAAPAVDDDVQPQLEAKPTFVQQSVVARPVVETLKADVLDVTLSKPPIEKLARTRPASNANAAAKPKNPAPPRANKKRKG